MSNALARGRTLEPLAVHKARRWRNDRIKQLLSVDRLMLSSKETSEARRLTRRWDFWNYKEVPNGTH